MILEIQCTSQHHHACTDIPSTQQRAYDSQPGVCFSSTLSPSKPMSWPLIVYCLCVLVSGATRRPIVKASSPWRRRGYTSGCSTGCWCYKRRLAQHGTRASRRWSWRIRFRGRCDNERVDRVVLQGIMIMLPGNYHQSPASTNGLFCKPLLSTYLPDVYNIACTIHPTNQLVMDSTRHARFPSESLKSLNVPPST